MRLLDPYGGVVFGPQYFNDVDVLTLSIAGTYTLLVEGNVGNSATVAYSFNVQPVTDDSAILTVGATVSGSIAHAGQVDRYSFTLGEAKRLCFDALTGDSQVNWMLSGPRGTEVSWRSFSSSDSGSLYGSPVLTWWRATTRSPCTVPCVRPARTVSGCWTLGTPRRSRRATPVSGTLDPGNETDAFRFTAQAGDRLYFSALSFDGSYYSTYWSVYCASGCT